MIRRAGQLGARPGVSDTWRPICRARRAHPACWTGGRTPGMRSPACTPSTRSGTNLLADSRLVVPESTITTGLGPQWRQALPIADGRGVLAVVELSKDRRTSQKLAEFSARTGQAVRVLNHIPLYRNYEQVFWASPSGRSVLVTGTRPVSNSPGSSYLAEPGVLTGGHFTPIPWPGQNFAAAW